MTVATATYVPLLPVSTVDEDEHVAGSANHAAVVGRRVVLSAGNGAGALRTKGRRRLWQRLGFVVAAVAAVAALASVVSTWSIIGPVGYDPATALWTVPVAEVGGRTTTNQSSAVTRWTPPEARWAIPTESSSTPPSTQRATLTADSATGRNGVAASVASARPSISPLDAKTSRVDDSGSDQSGAGPGLTSGESGPGSVVGKGNGSDAEPDAGSVAAKGKGSDG
ncbi:MAG TPA: hypothetical protein VNT27_13130, partial [Propionibacteriaceae bacterium]|nr:hypothetical protein [Propionibacteriaceae bacterium]